MGIIGVDVDPDDVIGVYCKKCNEEYQLMAGETECPICGNETEEPE